MMRRSARMSWRVAVGCLFTVGVAVGGALAVAQPAAATATAPTAPAPAAGTWQPAKTVDLPPSLNRGGPYGTVNSIACPSPGNCTAVGQFTAQNTLQAFAVSEVNHVWHTAVEPLGTVSAPYSAPNLVSVSCASAGNCSAAGVITYKTYTEGVVATEVNGVWSESGDYAGYQKGAQFNAVSCPRKAATDCVNVGSYVDASGNTQALPSGSPPGVGPLNAGGNAAYTSVSCSSAGNCALGGYYTDAHGNRQAFVVTLKKGVFKNAREVAGSLNSSGHAQVNAISCASAGNCVAVGQYFRFVSPNAMTEAFEVTEKNGTWSSAAEVAGRLNVGNLAVATAVSCAPWSGSLNCALGGHYYDKNGHQQAFVDLLKKGAWQQASAIGTGHNVGGFAQVSTVSCPAAGDCAAGGFYLSAPGSSQQYEAFLVSLENFKWQSVEEVAGSLNTGMTAHVNAVSCPSVSFCAAGGYYSAGPLNGTLPFTVDGAVTQSTKTALSLSAATVKWGHEQAEHIAVTVTPADAGPAQGAVTVAAGKTVLCKLTLSSGQAACTLTAKKLGPGSYHVTATYAGATYFAKSASAAKPLKVTGTQSASAAPAATSVTWGTAKPVVLPPVINFGQAATLTSISCPSVGNCTAVGHFTDAHENRAAIGVSEVNHKWAAAVQPSVTTGMFFSVPDLVSVSCSSAGNCTAVGVMTYKGAYTIGLLIGETKGGWHSGDYFYEDNKGTQITAVSCPHKTGADCAAGGYYVDSSGNQQGLLLTEQHGSWGDIPAVPGLGPLNAGGNAAVTSISCPSAGNCTAGGYFTDANGHQQAFVISEKKGTWGKAGRVAGKLNTGGHAQVNALSCASVGNCVAVGQYFRYVAPNVSTQAFEVTEKNGSWSLAAEVPGTGSLNADGLAIATSVSCVPSGSPLNCALGGRYQDKNGHAQAFVDLLKKGSWQKASAIATAHNHGGYAQVSTVSCPAAGDCAAGGYYLTAPGSTQKYEAFVVTLKGYSWQSVQEVPGTQVLNKGMIAHVNSVSCPSTAFCATGGFYSDGHHGDTLPFTADGAITGAG